jgi:uncharacterized protein
MIAIALVWLLALAPDFNVPPTPDHHVTDNVGVLSSTTRESVENELQAYEATTGHQILVWIGETTAGIPLETWTNETAERWKVGRRGHDDGAILFIFMQDRKVRIEVGYGLESALPDAAAFRIINDDIVPRMKAGDPNGAVSAGVAAMLTTITPSYTSVTPPPEGGTVELSNSAAIIVVAVIGVIILFVILSVIVQAIATALFGSLVMRRRGVRGAFLGGGFSSFGGGFGGGGFGGGGGFSAGGGGFGGGGASGGW